MEAKSKEISFSQIELVPYNSNDHLQKLTNWLQDKDLMHGWGMNTFENSEEVNKWASDSTRVVLMVKDVVSCEIVGMVNFYDWDKEKQTASRGTLIDPKFQNKGYGKAAIFLSNKYAFDEMKLTRIELYVEGYNEVSRHITEKLGYKLDRYDSKKDKYYYFMDNPTK
ncbi:GNAT family N-acetyltransferase [Candidatus Dojkabacteria bacterium]|nr:GNAT family N-acetyltransferase [Candidatus Dojkabacteria bacterium]